MRILNAELTQKISTKEGELEKIKQGGTTKISSLKYDIQSKINRYSNLLINNNNGNTNFNNKKLYKTRKRR